MQRIPPSSSSSQSTAGNNREPTANPNIRVMLTGIVPNCLLGKALTINLTMNGIIVGDGNKELIAKYLNETTVKHFKLEILQNLLEEAEKDFGGLENSVKHASVSKFASQAKLLDFKLIKMGFLMENERSLNHYVKYQASSSTNNISDSMTFISLHAVFQDYNDLMIMVEERLQHELYNPQDRFYSEREKIEGSGDVRQSIDIEYRENTPTSTRGCCTIL